MPNEGGRTDVDTLILDSAKTKVIDRSPFYDQVFRLDRYTISKMIKRK